MSIQLDVLCAIGMPTGDQVDIVRRRFRSGEGPRVAMVAGIRGDTPEGVRIAHRVASVLEAHHGQLSGSVDIYPCVNPLAAHRGVRQWPFFDQDLNRRFPGRRDGHAPDQVASRLLEDLQGADHVLEIRGAHPAFSETPQAHVRGGDAPATDLARRANVNVVWARGPGPAAPLTFAYQFPHAIVIEGGTGNRLRPGIGQTLADGVLNLLNVIGVLPDDALPFHWAGISRPAVVGDEQVHRVRTEGGGLFLPELGVWDPVEAGGAIGAVVDPITGQLREKIVAPAPGRLMAVREQPVVFPGSMVARVVEVPVG